jgi:hypothetical protein
MGITSWKRQRVRRGFRKRVRLGIIKVGDVPCRDEEAWGDSLLSGNVPFISSFHCLERRCYNIIFSQDGNVDARLLWLAVPHSMTRCNS